MKKEKKSTILFQIEKPKNNEANNKFYSPKCAFKMNNENIDVDNEQNLLNKQTTIKTTQLNSHTASAFNIVDDFSDQSQKMLTYNKPNINKPNIIPSSSSDTNLKRHQSFNPKNYGLKNKISNYKRISFRPEMQSSKCILIKSPHKSLEAFITENQKDIKNITDSEPKKAKHLERPQSFSNLALNKLPCKTFRSSNNNPYNQINTVSNKALTRINTTIHPLFEFSNVSPKSPIINPVSIVITDNIINQSDSLEIKDEIGSLFRGQKIIINAAGIFKGGLRQRRDGVTVFGAQNGTNNIDFDLNIRYNKDKSNIIFKIEFNQENMTYFLRSPKRNISNIVFIQINDKLTITNKKKQIVLGKELYSFSSDLNTNILIVKQYDKETKKENSKFYQKKDLTEEKGKIYFCDWNDKWFVSFNESTSSWFIDHDFEINAVKCWAVLEDSIEIKDNLLVKICKNVFKINIIRRDE